MTRIKKLLLGGGVAACAIIALFADRLLLGDGRTEVTDDAYVTADFSIVAPKVGGLIDTVSVEDNQQVRAGQELAHIDDRDYRSAVAAAEAALASAQAKVEGLTARLARQRPIIAQAEATIRSDDAALGFAQANATRYHNLSRGGAGTVEQQQQSASQLQQAVAAKDRDVAAAAAAQQELAVLAAQRDEAGAEVKRAQAALEQARLNLSYTHILAPIDGVVGQRSLRVGNFVSPGTALLAVVPLQSAYVLANFQETQLTHLMPGQKARIIVDSFQGQTLNGTVDSLAPASGIAFSPIPPDNATGNFTKVVQRIPLKIGLDPGQALAQRLRVGMSVEVSLDMARSGHDDRNAPQSFNHEAGR
ncbi:membrane fusion protein (multidrug efflux system) [Nitrospirillum amazonense]|uniref:Membrane fusion protein (Multidrug efflux system) n=1 Tax=Nitrospirillum amazonense TaxID=28077 RepID=A0A560EL44_9PROT|nr:HlyD family secretion protein [Nitrospirillum amazonense]TWB10092.1 membrane fusion protein (multidrug efflux system) [Nitrospirillum amazonense]